MTDYSDYWWDQRLTAATFAAQTSDDIQAAGDDLRDRDDYTDYHYPIPYPPRPEDLA